MTPRVVTIQRDPFARAELVRQRCLAGARCDWCGQPARWRYGLEADARPGRIAWSSDAFCSVACCRTYHNP